MNNLNITEFGSFPNNYQFRPHVCKEFIRLLSSSAETEILILETRPGIGATCISAEYLSVLTEPGLLLTIHAGSRAGYSLPFLMDQVLQQAYALLEESPKQINFESQISEWHQVLARLQRKVRNSHNKLHIIVDGLHQIPSNDERYLQEVIRDVLALGNKDVRHILTWREGAELPKLLQGLVARKVPIPPLSEQESKNYLKAEGIDEKLSQEVFDAAVGVPALLASSARLHKIGKLDAKSLHTDLASNYELEWDALQEVLTSSLHVIERVFAFLVFSKKPLNTNEISLLVLEDASVVGEIISKSDFLKKSSDGFISFTSNTSRDFIKSKLESLRIEVLNTFVTNIVADPLSGDSIQLLPNYYEELGRDEDIVTLLTPDNLDIYLGETQSLTALRRRNELGFRAAKRSQKEIEAYRFGLQTSIVRTLEGHDGKEAKLAALATTGRIEAALELAQGEPTKESRLLLLSQYVKILFAKGIKVDDVLADTIGTLIAEIDFTEDKDRAVAIAENLVGPFPELGITLVEQSAEGAKDYQDAAFTHLVLKTRSEPNQDLKVSAEKYASKVTNANIQGFLRATESLFLDTSVEEIKRTTAGLDGRQRSFLLRRWIMMHSKDKDVLIIADYALDEVVRDPSYLPSAGDLREICLAIADSSDYKLATAVLERIEAQRSALLEVTATVDKFRLDLEIARARTALGIDNHDDVLTDLYVRVSDMKDESSKLECFSWMRSALDNFKNIPSLIDESYKSLCEGAVQDSLDICLSSTAEHLEVFKGAMHALVECRPEMVFDMISKLNTVLRRDEAYSLFIEKYTSRQSKKALQIHLINKALTSIVEDEVRWGATVTSLRLLALRKPSLETPPQSLILSAQNIEDPLGRAFAWRWIVLIANHYNVSLDLEKAASDFNKISSEIDQVWRVPELNYWLIESFAKVDTKFANSQLDKYELESSRNKNISPTYAELLVNLARLSIISFAGILQQQIDTDEELDSLCRIITLVPSVIMQIDLFADLALRAFSKNRKDVFEKICDSRIQRLITLYNGPKQIKNRLCFIAYAPIYLWNNRYGDSLIQDLPEDKKNDCRRELLVFCITKKSIYEPYQDHHFSNCKLTYSQAVTIVGLIEEMTIDSVLASSIEAFSYAATSTKSNSEITKHQRVNFAQQILKKSEQILPDVKNIKHDGWKIVIKAWCFVLSDETSQEKWKKIIEEGKNLPNSSDTVYVLTTISQCLPKKLNTDRNNLIKDIESRLTSISSLADRVKRLISLSNASVGIEAEHIVAKRLLTNAMKDSLLIKDSEVASEAQRQIIDTAYQLDKDFAVELTKLIDDDPARVRARAEANDLLKSQKNKLAILARKNTEIDDDINDVGRIGWELLAALNADKVAPQKHEDLSKLLKAGYKRNLSEVMGFYWWYLRNLQAKYESNKSSTQNILLPIFEVTRLAALLAEKIGKRVCGKPDFFHFSSSESKTTSFIATPGERENAIVFIKEWIDNLEDLEIIICDPYFKPTNIDFVKDLSFYREGLSFSVLTCVNDGSISGNLDYEYRSAWSKLAFTEPPPLRAIHVSYEGDKHQHPIHDRWIIGGNAALRVGTSLSSLGLSKLSEISEVNSLDVDNIRGSLQPFLNMTERWIDGRRLRYNVVQW